VKGRICCIVDGLVVHKRFNIAALYRTVDDTFHHAVETTGPVEW
jgi:hypothetical protein